VDNLHAFHLVLLLSKFKLQAGDQTMKLAFYDDFKLGVIEGDQIIDASAAIADLNYHTPQELLEMVIGGWEKIGAKIGQSAQGQAGVPLDSVKLRPPVPRPGQLVCLAVNYIEPARPDRAEFNAFLKSNRSVIASGETVELAPAPATVFHFEPELALVIGKRASRISAAQAMSHIFGYTQFMDVSARGLPGGFFLGKSWHTFGPMGPALATADEIAAPNKLLVRLWVNDEPRQDFSTSEMARHVPELLEEVTKVLTLEPGDVVATGTHHLGLGPVQHGNVVRLSIEGLGPALQVNVHDPQHRSW
jgi:2-keto-4-pentenoate hydratase/2-oxohepta-3-ene-1,7-dioic acid hydratase in catechol pathway